MFDVFRATQRQHADSPIGSCAPQVGIALQPQVSGTALNQELVFDLITDGGCVITGESMECNLVSQEVTAEGKTIVTGRDGCVMGTEGCVPMRGQVLPGVPSLAITGRPAPALASIPPLTLIGS